MKPLELVGVVHVILIAVSLITGSVVNVTPANTTGIVTKFGGLDTVQKMSIRVVMVITYSQV